MILYTESPGRLLKGNHFADVKRGNELVLMLELKEETYKPKERI